MVQVNGAWGEIPRRTRSESAGSMRAACSWKRSSAEASSPKTSRKTVARRPVAAAASAAAPTKLQSPIVVTPERRHSQAPSSAIARMSSSASAYLRRMCSPIHGTNGSPSPKPA